MTGDKTRLIYDLWRLLDHIEVLDNEIQDDTCFRKAVNKLLETRYNILNLKEIDNIYSRFNNEEGR